MELFASYITLGLAVALLCARKKQILTAQYLRQHCGRREVRVCITLDEKTIMSPPLKIQARVYNALRNEECETYEKITSGMTEDKGKQHLENEESSSPFLDSSDDSTSAPGSISSTTVSPDADYGNTDQLSVPTLFIQNKPSYKSFQLFDNS